MLTLYIDSSHYLTLGLLDESFAWIDYCEFKEKKTSGILHVELLEMLKRNKLAIDQLTQVVEAAGPGSYTGMRVAEGLCQILEWQQRECRSFYHFEVPALCGIEQGVWIAKAFKGEIFCYHFNGEASRVEFIRESELEEYFKQWQRESLQVFGHYQDDLSAAKELTSALIYRDAQDFFKKVWERGERKGPYYFRALEQEFKVSR